MTYTVWTIDRNENEYTVTEKCRATAAWKTIIRKCAFAMLRELTAKGIGTGNAKLTIDPPNVWTNGAVGGAWLDIDGWSYPLDIVRQDGCVEARA